MPGALRLADDQGGFPQPRGEIARARQAAELRPLLNEVRSLLDQAGTHLIGQEKTTLALVVRATERLANAVDLLAAPIVTAPPPRAERIEHST